MLQTLTQQYQGQISLDNIILFSFLSAFAVAGIIEFFESLQPVKKQKRVKKIQQKQKQQVKTTQEAHAFTSYKIA